MLKFRHVSKFQLKQNSSQIHMSIALWQMIFLHILHTHPYLVCDTSHMHGSHTEYERTYKICEKKYIQITYLISVLF
jgi:hypothetical protein